MNHAVFMAEAHAASQASSDLGTKTGCALVTPSLRVIRASNRLAEGVQATPERMVRPEKYLWIPHAEQSVIANAARLGIPTYGASIYIQWLPCMPCAQSIILAGIKAVYVDRKSHEEKFTQKEKWQADFDRVEALLSEGGVTLEWLELREVSLPIDRVAF